MAFAVRLSGDLDADSSGRLSAEFDRLVALGAKVLVVDCSEVSFIDSSGLRVLVAASKALDAVDGQVFIEGMSATVQRILEITGLLEHYTRR
jgi:anti-anti-sigma factor